MSASPELPKRRSRRTRGGFGLWLFIVNLLALLALIYGVLALSEREVAMPDWVTERVEARINAAIAPAHARIDAMAVSVDRDGVPRLAARDVTLIDAGGAVVARLNALSARAAPAALAQGRFRPERLRLTGAQIVLRRDRDGLFSLSFGGDDTAMPRTAQSLVTALDAVVSGRDLAHLETIGADAMTIALEDARSGRVWQASNAVVSLEIEDAAFRASLITEVFNGTDDLADLQVSVEAQRAAPDIVVTALIGGVPAADLALHSPALSFLSVVEAPIDGALRARFGAGDALSEAAARLEFGRGALTPTAGATYAFDTARAYLTFDPDTQRLTFSELSMASDMLRLSGEGHAYLRDVTDGWPGRLVGQVRLSDALFADRSLLPDPVAMSGVVADLNVTLSPFKVGFGQIVALALAPGAQEGADMPERRLTASGEVRATDAGWQSAFDFDAGRLSPEDVLSFWPPAAADGARSWVSENVLDGTLRNISGRIRLSPSVAPHVALRFDFEEARVRYLPEFPPIEEGAGWASIEGNAFALHLERGAVAAPDGARLSLAGSTMKIADLRPAKPEAVFDLHSEGPLAAALRVLDRPPLSVLETSGLDAGLVSGQARARSRIIFDLARDVPRESVRFSVDAVLSELASESLMPGMPLSARRLDLRADNAGIALSGAVRAADLSADIRWTRDFGPGEDSLLRAEMRLGPELLRAFGSDPAALGVSGSASALLEVGFSGNAPAEVALVSDLRGLAADVPAIGWSKAAAAGGQLDLIGTFEDGLSISQIRMSAPGLRLVGAPRLGEDGEIATLRFSALDIGDWFSGPTEIVLPTAGASRLAVLGGRVDLRARPPMGERPGRDALGIELALDEVIVSRNIRLSPFSARLPSRGATGRFDARVNARVPVSGDLIPQSRGFALRLRSEQGGDVLSEAGILPGATEGRMRVTLVPGATDGSFEGELAIEGMLLQDAPAIAQLFDAVSVFGLLDELTGPGIRFESVRARFWLGPDEIRLMQSSAVGASLGISADGTYMLDRGILDLQGVVSPFYLINGLGAALTRRGEGLFGMSFRMAGDARAPAVTVNPLSILTPGMFREIFRRPAPVGDPQRVTQ